MNNVESPQSTPAPDISSRRTRSRVPPKWVWIVWLILATLGLIAWKGDLFDERAYSNITIWISSFIAVVIFAVWFYFLSGFSKPCKLIVLFGSVACFVLLAVFFRVERVTGTLSPTFAFRFSAKPDQLMQLPPEKSPKDAINVDLHTTTENDFPQFLGPERSQHVQNVRLARSWTDNKPDLVWRCKIGAGWPAFAIVGDHAVTMEQRGDCEMVTCYGLKSGELEWFHADKTRYEKLEAGVGPRSTPTIDDGRVYALGAYGHLMCLDGATGKPIWEKDLLKEYAISRDDEASAVPWGRANSPLVVGDQVIVPIGGKKGRELVSLAAFDKLTGKLLWNGGQKQISYCSPNIAKLAGIEQILIANEAAIAGHDVKTGRQLWEYPWPGRTNADPNVSQVVPIPPNRAFISKGYGGGAMLIELAANPDGSCETKKVWKNPRVMKSKFCNVTILDGYAYGLSDAVLECVDLSNGESKWKNGRYGHGQILGVRDLLLVLTEDGQLVLVEASPDRPNHVLGRIQAIEGLTWNNLALSGPYLLVRNAEEAACYKLPLEDQP